MRRWSIAENLVIICESKRKGLETVNNKHLGLSYSVSGKPFQEKHSLVRQRFKYKDVLYLEIDKYDFLTLGKILEYAEVVYENVDNIKKYGEKIEIRW